METTTQRLPKWFKGQLYTEGAKVRNQFSGQTYELTNIELSIYDYLMGCQTAIEMNGGLLNPSTSELQGELRKGLDWFRTHNAKAYMVLLD